MNGTTIGTYTNSGGTLIVSFNGSAKGSDIPGEDFYRALLRIWIGDKPVQDDIKEHLLGKAQ